MKRRKSIIGMLLLTACALCAVMAQSAAAAGHEYEATTNTTAYTCKPEAEGEFKDEHCDTYAGRTFGSFSHEAIPVGTKTEITTTNEKTGPETKSAEKAVLEGTLFGVKSKITAKTVHGTGWIKNVEPAAGQMQVEGEITTKFTEVNVDEPTCSITEPIEFTMKFRGVKDKSEPTKMGIEYSPLEGTPSSSCTSAAASSARPTRNGKGRWSPQETAPKATVPAQQPSSARQTTT